MPYLNVWGVSLMYSIHLCELPEVCLALFWGGLCSLFQWLPVGVCETVFQKVLVLFPSHMCLASIKKQGLEKSLWIVQEGINTKKHAVHVARCPSTLLPSVISPLDHQELRMLSPQPPVVPPCCWQAHH